ncbi:hypothetical protein J2Z22_001695 [Paenibacillus forsythiae]|uniref:Nucleotidyltransferase domain-containing protein n=1 Tax=Paenibacillus forsythiae TaxID=365616 RepID=A0ABU3H5S9_9BACL|nr:hypothetical protein [Paenibacillus forsythiae]MDT3426175.1 hypothetical protein [Paenibacillus forsythiae]
MSKAYEPGKLHVLSPEQQDLIVQKLREAFDTYAIILLGSAAKGTLRQ